MKLLTFVVLLIGSAQFVEAQTYYPSVYSGYSHVGRTAGGVDQPNAQFIRNQMEQQRRQVEIGNAQFKQWDAIRSYELINGRRER